MGRRLLWCAFGSGGRQARSGPVRGARPLRWLRAVSIAAARGMLPAPARRSLRRWWERRALRPRVGRVRFGDLRRLEPISKVWGFERGLPIDRYYIERFLSRQARDIQGTVLEIGDDTYTRRFGRDRVARSEVLHVAESGPPVTIVADLTCADHLPSDTFDCVILTQTLPFIYDVRAALATIHRLLRPVGILLATFPGISRISRYDMDCWGHYWSLTTRSAQHLLREVFPATNVEIEAHGNVLAAIAFLHGLAAQELRPAELNQPDPDFEVLITVRATKSGEAPGGNARQ